MYQFLRKPISRLISQILIGVLVSNFIIPNIHAQDPRRGLFLQGQDSGPGGADSFGDRRGDQFEQPEQLEGVEGLPGQEMMGMPPGATRGMMDRMLIYQVHVLGEVRKPGTYRVNPSMRVTDALKQAGNIKPNGSERFVELRKPGQAKGQVLDLFAYKVFGNLSQNPYLQDNDTIFIPLKKMAIQIEGPVRRPGIFELKNEHTLSDIVQLAGGYTVGVSNNEPIRVIRYGGYEEKEIIEVPIGSGEVSNFQVQDGDVIVVPHKFLTKHEFDYNVKKLPNDNLFYPTYDDRVFVIGAVRAPGAFDFNQYYTLRQYLTLAGGTTTMAKNGKIKVMTVDGKTFKAKNGNYDRAVNPGDTIVVPEKSIPNSFYIGLLPTIASLGLSAAALFR